VHASKRLGNWGENRAAGWYLERGFHVLERNWRTSQGEIDLLCTRDGVLVVCEVKTRRTDRLGTPVEAVTRDKQRRLRHLAAAYLRASPGGYDEVRFDVVSVLGSTLTVIEGAF
jgi:putative endonuclease